MSVRVALVDYGAGNLASVRKALAACGADVFAPAAPGDLGRADVVVVPGVGHFSQTRALDERWRGAVRAGLGRGQALVGICLGMQWLFEGSEEAPGCPGLGLLPGRCVLLGAGALPRAEGAEAGPARLKVPHVGWNRLDVVRPSRMLAALVPGAQAYFTHSYAAPVTRECVAMTCHGERFASAVEEGRVFGVQFHPEKSGEVGLAVLGGVLAGR